MALRQLTTNLRSLKFGNDQMGGGSSNQPYIQTPINSDFNNPSNIYKTIVTGFSNDAIIRGGTLSLLNSAEDTIRIGKFFNDKSKGPLFVIKQIGLQLSNPKIETGKTFGLENTRIYNGGINTLAQIPVNAFGIHFNRSGITPIISDNNKYAYVVDFNNKNFPSDNRLVKLYTDKGFNKDIPSTEITKNAQKKFEKIINKLDKINQSGLGKFANKITGGGFGRTLQGTLEKARRNLNPKYYIISDYWGGPGSTYGIGRTTINRYSFSDSPQTENSIQVEGNLQIKNGYRSLTALPSAFVEQYQDSGISEDINNVPTYLFQTSKIDKTEEILKSLDTERGYIGEDISHLNSLSYTYDEISNQSIGNNGKNRLIGTDFRKNINKIAGKTVIASTDYEQYNMINRINIGDPGNPTRKRIKINEADELTQDKINMLPIFREDISANQGGTVNINGKPYSTRDLIKFHFEAVDNDNTNNLLTNKIIFRAFIDSFSDSTSAEWNNFKYVGRGENFYTYNGFNRQVNISFKIAAQSREEMKPLYQKLNYLISNTAPDYQRNGFMRGPFMLFTLGNWFYRQPIIINSITNSIKDNYPWEIAMDRPEEGDDKTMTELPQVIDVSLSITLIHNFIPRKGVTIPFINTGHLESNNWLKQEEFNTNVL